MPHPVPWAKTQPPDTYPSQAWLLVLVSLFQVGYFSTWLFLSSESTEFLFVWPRSLRSLCLGYPPGASTPDSTAPRMTGAHKPLHNVKVAIPTPTYGHELRVVIKRTRSWTRAGEMRFLRRVAGLGLDIWREHEVELLLLGIKKSQLSWFGHLMKTPPIKGVLGMTSWEWDRGGEAQDLVEGLYILVSLCYVRFILIH